MAEGVCILEGLSGVQVRHKKASVRRAGVFPSEYNEVRRSCYKLYSSTPSIFACWYSKDLISVA